MEAHRENVRVSALVDAAYAVECARAESDAEREYSERLGAALLAEMEGE